MLFDELLREYNDQLRGDQDTDDCQKHGLLTLIIDRGVFHRRPTVGQSVVARQRVLTQQIENHRQETLLNRSSDPLAVSIRRMIRNLKMKCIDNSGDRSR
jgi:hypothetical protein